MLTLSSTCAMRLPCAHDSKGIERAKKATSIARLQSSVVWYPRSTLFRMFDHMVISCSAWYNLIFIQSIAVTITVSNAKNVVLGRIYSSARPSCRRGRWQTGSTEPALSRARVGLASCARRSPHRGFSGEAGYLECAQRLDNGGGGARIEATDGNEGVYINC